MLVWVLVNLFRYLVYYQIWDNSNKKIGRRLEIYSIASASNICVSNIIASIDAQTYLVTMGLTILATVKIMITFYLQAAFQRHTV